MTEKTVVLEYLGDDFPKMGCRLSYHYQAPKPPVLPAPDFTIAYHIRINGFPLASAAATAVAQCHAHASLWSELDFVPEAHFGDGGDNSEFEFRFAPNPELSGSLHNITITINLYTAVLMVSVPTLLLAINTLLQTVYINLEYELPLMFSVYGRRLLRQVKPYIDNVYQVMLAPTIDPELIKLEQVIRCLHNTLNVMLAKTPLRGIRHQPYDLRMLRHRRIDL